MIKIGLGGSGGRMGNAVKELARTMEGVEISVTFDPKEGDFESISDCPDEACEDVDVYVDFTHPDAVFENVKSAAEKGVDVLIGTTGWYDRKNEVEDIAEAENVRILYAPNFSIGVNALFAVVENLSSTLGELGYDASVQEKHHTGKADSPSGTAKTLGEILVDNIPGKESMAFERRGKRDDDEVDVLGARVGSVAGEHEVTFVPENEYAEKLKLTHNAYGTEVFAKGALTGVKWLDRNQDMGSGLYNFKDDVLEL